jgi:hypothetical protein
MHMHKTCSFFDLNVFRVLLTCSVYAGTKKKYKKAPKCEVGDKIGCGIDTLSDGSRQIYFTHNSKSVSEMHFLALSCSESILFT